MVATHKDPLAPDAARAQAESLGWDAIADRYTSIYRQVIRS